MRTAWVILVPCLVLAGCKKLADAPDLPDGSLKAEVLFLHGDDLFTPGDVITDSAGRAVALDRFRFAVGALWLQDDAHGNVAEYPANHWILDSAIPQSEQAIGDLPALHTHALIMTLGVDENFLPADGTWTDPASGPFFLELIGRVDDDADGMVQADDPTVHVIVPTTTPRYYAMVDAHAQVEPGMERTVTIGILTDLLLADMDALAAAGQQTNDTMALTMMRNTSAAIRAL
jgi:hypothetical protein